MVAKVQLLLQTGVYHKSLDGLTEADWKLLEGIGYGNLFSIFSAYGEPDIVFVLAWADNDFLEGWITKSKRNSSRTASWMYISAGLIRQGSFGHQAPVVFLA